MSFECLGGCLQWTQFLADNQMRDANPAWPVTNEAMITVNASSPPTRTTILSRAGTGTGTIV